MDNLVSKKKIFELLPLAHGQENATYPQLKASRSAYLVSHPRSSSPSTFIYALYRMVLTVGRGLTNSHYTASRLQDHRMQIDEINTDALGPIESAEEEFEPSDLV